MRWTHVPNKVTRSTKLWGAQYSPELALRNTDFRSAPENLNFPALPGLTHLLGRLGKHVWLLV